jgi:TonB-dependent receptor
VTNYVENVTIWRFTGLLTRQMITPSFSETAGWMKLMSLGRIPISLIVSLGGLLLCLHFVPESMAQEAGPGPSASPPPSLPLNPIVVTETNPHSETDTIAQQITEQAANLETVQSREQTSRYPDVTLGDSIRRLPGVGAQYNQGEALYVSVRGIDPNLVGVTFNGVLLPATDSIGRHVSLNQIPSSLVSQIILTQSNTPDQDAEALGGTIELTPRSAFDSASPILEGHMGSGFYALRPGNPLIDASITVGATFGFGPDGNPFGSGPGSPSAGESDIANDGKTQPPVPQTWGSSRPFGILGTFTYYDDHRAVDNFQVTYDDATPLTYAEKATKELDFYNFAFHRRTFGYGFTFDYRPSENAKFYVSYSDGGYIEDDVRYGLSLLNLSAGPGATTPDANGFFKTNQGELESSLRYKNGEYHENQVVQGGGRVILGPVILDFRGSFAEGYSQVPQDTTVNFVTAPDQTIVYRNLGDSNQPTIGLQGSPGNSNPYDPNLYKFSSLKIDRNGSTDAEVSGAANATIPFQLGDFSAAIKFGTDLRFKTKDRYDDPQTYSSYAGPAVNGQNNLTLADVSGSAFQSDYDGFYGLGFSPSLPKWVAFFGAHQSDFVRNSTADQVTSLQAYYNDSENIFAGYAQGDIDIGPLNLLSGLRIEATQGVYGAFANRPGTNPADPTSYQFVNRDSNYYNVFPTFQARYEITSNLQARFSYSTAIGRPTFGQITASTIVDSVDRTITTGNPALKPTTDNSFDLALDYSPFKSSYFSVGVFDKEIANYIFQRSIIVPLDGTFYTESTFLNGGSAYSRGIELNYQQQFVDLPAPLSGFGIAANYTYTSSNASVHPGFFGQLPYTARNLWNAGIFYSGYRFTFSLAANFVDRNLAAVGSSPQTDQYFDKHLALDLSASYEFRSGISIYFHAKNLTNAPFRVYEGSPNRPIQREYYGETYEAGVQWKYF